jgi:flavodoxin
VGNKVFMAFYSRRGHTRELGEAICQGLQQASIDVECLELVPERQVNVLSASASSFTRSPEPIKDCQVDLDGVNLLVLGTPIWGGLPAPYMRTFLQRVNDLKGLPVVLFATCAYDDRNASHELRDMVRTWGGRPMDYHLWRTRKGGRNDHKAVAESVVDSSLCLLPSERARTDLD